MAIKKLSMVNIVCRRNGLDELIRDLILIGKCEFIDTFLEINEGEFNIGISKEHADEILDMEDIVPIKENKEIKQYTQKLEQTLQDMKYEPKIKTKYMHGEHHFEKIKKEIDQLCDDYASQTEDIRRLTENIHTLEELKPLDYMKNIDVDFSKLINLHHFTMKFGYLTREKARKIAQNYENIKAIVLHVGSSEEKEFYMILTPKSLDVEMGRILRSTNFMEIAIPESYLDVPSKMLDQIHEDLHAYKQQLKEVLETAKHKLHAQSEAIDILYSKLIMEGKIDTIRVKVGATANFAYLSAWVPSEKQDHFEEAFAKHPDILVSYKTAEEVSPLIPVPTRMENNFFFQPFETLVNMYGTPSHNEIDPTAFMGIAYVLLFGAMFGDLGQGLILVLAGLLLKKKVAPEFCGILTRIGVGSMLFGVLYDSFFGYEEVISKFLPGLYYLRPIENINLILELAIGVGIFLLYVSFVYSIINKLRIGDIEEGVFGRNGLNGAFLMTFLILLVLNLGFKIVILPNLMLYIAIIISLALLVIKLPLTNLIKYGKFGFRLEDESDGYYIESGFDVLETLLSTLSNSTSFIRVGAFALNHVGLFIAFQTLADLIGNTGGNIFMFFLGNAIIIGLEGLIVFIQGLRLFYYEIFSKYYSGDGVPYMPDKL